MMMWDIVLEVSLNEGSFALKKSTKFLILFIVGLILFPPVKVIVEVTLIKFELKKAVVHFAKEYCDVDVKVTNLDIDYFYIKLFGRYWSAETTPDIGRIDGTYDDDGFLKFSGIEGCVKEHPGFLLDTKSNRFIKYNEYFVPEDNTHYFYGYFFACCIGAVIYTVLLGRDGKGESNSN